MIDNYQTAGWPLGPTSTIYMDGTAVFNVREYGEPGIKTTVVLTPKQAEDIREVVSNEMDAMSEFDAREVMADAMKYLKRAKEAEAKLAAIEEILEPEWIQGKVLPAYLGAENAARMGAIMRVWNDNE